MPTPTPDWFYRTIRLTRRFEERAMELVRSGDIAGGVHPCTGQEAVAAGCMAALRADDVITFHHRGHGHVLARGVDPGRLLAELTGRESGLNKGRGGSIHAADLETGFLGATGTVGSGAPIACGAAWAGRRTGSDRIAVSIFGDGAVNEGYVLESLNLAALLKLPILFVCENNGYSVSVPVKGMTAGSIPGRAEAFGIPASVVDGQDPEVVYAAMVDAVARTRAGGPVFIELVTYRFDVHHTRDFTVRLNYRSDEEVAHWRQRDPLEIAAARVDPQRRAEIDAEVEVAIARAAEFALTAPVPNPADALDYLYATGLRPRMGVV